MAVNILRDLAAGAIVLGVLVFIHEAGHFIVAKLCHVRVDVFSIGFGTRLWGKKHGDTLYQIAALPLGGYVKMAGDNPVEERTGDPHEYLSRPRWQRFLVVTAGPAMNILLTLAIIWGIYAFAGTPMDAYLRQPADVAAVPKTPDHAMPIRPGDQILAVNGKKSPTWGQVMAWLEVAKPGNSVQVTVLRDGAQQSFSVAIPQKQDASQDLDVLGYPLIPPVIDQVAQGLPAEKAGMKAGDRIVSMNGQPIVTWLQLTESVTTEGPHPIHFVVQRKGKDVPLEITPVQTMDPDGQVIWAIGVQRSLQEFYQREGALAAGKDAVDKTLDWIRQMGDVVVGLVRGQVSVRELAGPVGIVQLSGQMAQDGVVSLLTWTAYISLDLGIINLLPIPILDGGHVLMLVVEGSLRRDLSIAVKERFVQVGMVFLLCLLALAFYSDIHRLIGY